VNKTSELFEADDELSTTLSGRKPRYARLQSFATRQYRLSLLGELNKQEAEEISSWDDLKYEASPEEIAEQKKELSLHLFRQEQLVNRAKNLLINFDGKLNILRHDKYSLDIELKRSDLHLLIYQWEYKVLNDYEDRERELSREQAKLLLRQGKDCHVGSSG
jgi:hypothetical protein